MVQDEDIYTFFEPELPSEPVSSTRSKNADAVKASADKKYMEKPANNNRNSSKVPHSKSQKSTPFGSSEKRASANNHRLHNHATGWRTSQEIISWHEGSSVLDLKGDNYFSCAVGRKRSNARYLLNSSDDVVMFLKELAEACDRCCGSHSNGA